MSVYIVDASIAAKWFVEEEFADAALRLFDDANQLHAPDFLLLEMDSVLCKWIRRGTITVMDASDIRTALRQYPIHTHSFLGLLDPAYAIANQTGRSIYDCLYVVLATLLDGQMVTADRGLYDGLADGPLAEHVVWVDDIG